jgi:glutamyl-tRNA synthetase/glutamyl-Q tRNA(Asp) synthetase
MSGITRFAPSPTGYLHEGHLLSALYVWAAADAFGLKIHLRIEDHDQSRARPEYIRSIYEDLKWFGFEYDSESIQSNKNTLYERELERLKQQGLVYPCFCSRKQLEAENPKSATGEIVYQGKCRALATPAGGPHNLRIIVPDETIHWHDTRLGDFDENPKLQCGDFPIRDRDMQWTYQFAVCVDDIDEGITHIVRGEDIRSSTARQIALMRMLGRDTPPVYLHHPLIVDTSGKKLSKRELAHSIRQDREEGVSPETLLGRVCFKAGLQPENAPLSLDTAILLVKQAL